jgi:hypothetical protein
MKIWYILWSFGIFYRFGKLCGEKSGNPVQLDGKILYSLSTIKILIFVMYCQKSRRKGL